MRGAYPIAVRSFAAALALLAGGCTMASVAEPVEQAVLPGSPEAKAGLALQLAAHARRDRDPQAMLVAARMMLTSGTRPAALRDGTLQAEPGADPVAAGWAREAIVLAGDDPALREQAEDIIAMRPRGVLRSTLGAGPLRYVRRVSANETVQIGIRTERQSAARVAAIGDGDARIGLHVTAAGGMICESAARTTHSLCAWQAQADRHQLVLVNAGPLDSDVMLLSN